MKNIDLSQFHGQNVKADLKKADELFNKDIESKIISRTARTW